VPRWIKPRSDSPTLGNVSRTVSDPNEATRRRGKQVAASFLRSLIFIPLNAATRRDHRRYRLPPLRRRRPGEIAECNLRKQRRGRARSVRWAELFGKIGINENRRGTGLPRLAWTSASDVAPPKSPRHHRREAGGGGCEVRRKRREGEGSRP